ncbi:MAG: DIP1984 family protein [Pseudomonadota bacterium]|nr:DIP1984 family protein [Pseudomonadota bacterium]
MKLAEALLIRADQKKKILSLRERIARNALAQEGDAPREDAAKLIAECFAVMAEQQALVLKIDAANAAATLPDGRALAAVLGARDVLAQQHALLKTAVEATHKEADRYSPREIKWVPQIDVAATQKQMEDFSRKIRELNVLIQETNWRVEIG